MTNPIPAKVISEAHGFTEVDGIPVRPGQCHREGFFQLIDTMDGGCSANYLPNSPYFEYHIYEPWPTIPQNTLNRQ